MDYIKQKKIRSKLINFTNQQLKIRKTKNVKFLINSITLEELEKKNLQCKEFIIIEKPQIYQNINNNNSIVEQIFIHNNSFTSNIIIYPLSSRIINRESKNNEIDYNNLNITSFADYSKEKKERVLQKISKGLISKTQKNLESPNYKPCLIKKELMERKMKMPKNNEINSHHYNHYNKEKNENEKEIIENNKKDKSFSRQLSSETIATEISRIIRICYYDKSINSSKISCSNSRIKENDEIQKAKQFAKKLKYYCFTLKNKFPIRDKICKYKKIENRKNVINLKEIANHKNIDNKEKNNNLEDKIYHHKIKNKKNIFKDIIKYNYFKKFSEKIKEKNKHISDDNLNVIKFLPPAKRMISEKNIKNKIRKNNSILSEDNYNTEQSTNVQYQYKTIENNSKNKNIINTNTIRLSKKLKKKLTGKKIIIEQIEKKSPAKIKKKENDVIPEILFKKIKNKKADINKRETQRKRDKKNNNIKNNHKNELPFIPKNKVIKRQSIDIRMFGEGKGLESIIFDTKNLSTSEDIPFIQNNNKNNNTINSKAKKNNRDDGYKNNSKIKKKKNIKKKNNQTLNNTQENQVIRRSLKNDIQKKNTFHGKKKKNALDLSKKDKKRKLSLANCEEEDKKIINNNTIDFDSNKNKENQKKITFKLGEDFAIKINDNYNNEESEDLNEFDDYLYNKKIKRIKNTKKISHN